MLLPAEIIPVVAAFEPVFSQRTYAKAVELLMGTILARGRRTVTSALRALGKSDERQWSKYHHVLNRAQWSGLAVSQILLQVLVQTFVPGPGVVHIAVDETLERRWGPQIRQGGHWRDSRASSVRLNVSSRGLRWLVFALIVAVPWTPYELALPFLSVLLTTPKVSQKLGKRHKTVAQRTAQVVVWLRRMLAGSAIHLVGDGAYAVIELGRVCRQQQVTLIAPLRLDARLFEPPYRPPQRGRGRPPVVGARLPALADVAVASTTHWHRSRVPWYQASSTILDWTSGTALWYSTGQPPVPIRWVLVRDPQGRYPTRAFFSTDIAQHPTAILADFVGRWSLEVTFEEARAHLGLETQRQWSDLAIERTTPALLGIFSLVVLFAHSFFRHDDLPVQSTAWYPKSAPTFHDLLFAVRRSLWHHLFFPPDGEMTPVRKIDAAHWQHLISVLCY